MIFSAFFVNDVFLNFVPMRIGFPPCLSLISEGKSECSTTLYGWVFTSIPALIGHEVGLDGFLGGQDPVVGHCWFGVASLCQRLPASASLWQRLPAPASLWQRLPASASLWQRMPVCGSACQSLPTKQRILLNRRPTPNKGAAIGVFDTLTGLKAR
jgi:hypothetical protein